MEYIIGGILITLGYAAGTFIRITPTPGIFKASNGRHAK